ncbi:MAG: hypothetical protein A2993_02460 [Gammaproteobacteria bacterium RIFCSPLOWO2_01_FULL_47_190]|nr:MAG: hypothetical protein A2993_02460 [Gammaproteobacteria bacterium RIFCSPLOWO2_01_FULL_47_190]
MSSVKTNPDVNNHVKVIVRAYGDEPIILCVKSAGESTVEVYGDDDQKTINYPAQYVYKYDPHLYSSLKKAHNSNDKDTLATLWKNAAKYEGY